MGGALKIPWRHIRERVCFEIEAARKNKSPSAEADGLLG
jgi:hypothetical protein